MNGQQDKFFISNDFINQSLQNLSWNTVAAYLGFTTGTDNLHQVYLPAPIWRLTARLREQLRLGHPGYHRSADLPGGRQYHHSRRGVDAGLLLGAILNGNQVTNIAGNGLDLYYDPLLADNAYLHGGTYALLDGGSLAPVTHAPLPPTLWMVLSGLAGLGMLRRRKVNKS